ncbi:hypothetical protein [Streptomyces sp. NPDC007100]
MVIRVIRKFAEENGCEVVVERLLGVVSRVMPGCVGGLILY